MPVPYNDLLPATYNGVQFFWDNSDIQGGPKSVTYEYPQSNKRTVRFLGKNQRTLNVSGIVDNDRYRQRRQALIDELNKEEIGTLVLPLVGSIKVAVKSWGISESKSELGFARFTMQFEECDNSQVKPLALTSSKGEVTSKTQAVSAELETILSEGWQVTPAYAGNYDDAELIIDESMEVYNNAGREFATNARGDFTRLIKDSLLKINTLINTGSELGAALTSIQNEFTLLNDDPKERVSMQSQLFNFGDDFVPLKQDTAGRIERKKNRDLLILNTQGSALAQSYNDVIQIEFDTVEELDEVSKQIDEQYNAVIELPEVTDTLRTQLADLKAIARKSLEEQRVTAPRLTDIEVYKTPATVLTYQYYDDLENYDALINLNGIIETGNVNGTNRIFTA
jgi:prophage DNA circulation protein